MSKCPAILSLHLNSSVNQLSSLVLLDALKTALHNDDNFILAFGAANACE